MRRWVERPQLPAPSGAARASRPPRGPGSSQRLPRACLACAACAWSDGDGERSRFVCSDRQHTARWISGYGWHLFSNSTLIWGCHLVSLARGTGFVIRRVPCRLHCLVWWPPVAYTNTQRPCAGIRWWRSAIYLREYTGTFNGSSTGHLYRSIVMRIH